jgi:hypothetical protein
LGRLIRDGDDAVADQALRLGQPAFRSSRPVGSSSLKQRW